ncbi:MAG: helix-turn-helix domain-containing protein, partial [Clostridia bacterium]
MYVTDSRVYVDTKCAAILMGNTEQWICKSVASGKLSAEVISGVRGRGGITYRIPLDALPVEAQVKYWAQIGAAATQPGNADLTSYREKYGDEGLKELLDAQSAVRELTGMLTGGGKRGEIYEAVAQRHSISTRTLRRWEADYRECGLSGLMKPMERADAGTSRTICPWAGDYLKYMMAQSNKLCQTLAFERLLEAATRLGDNACDNCPYCEGSERRNDLSPDALGNFPACHNAANQRMIVPDNRHAVNRFMKGIPPQLLTYGRYGSRTWEAEFMQKVRRDKPARINECWFGDHHMFDLFV